MHYALDTVSLLLPACCLPAPRAGWWLAVVRLGGGRAARAAAAAAWATDARLFPRGRRPARSGDAGAHDSAAEFRPERGQAAKGDDDISAVGGLPSPPAPAPPRVPAPLCAPTCLHKSALLTTHCALLRHAETRWCCPACWQCSTQCAPCAQPTQRMTPTMMGS
jgi:hypothetical protein